MGNDTSSIPPADAMLGCDGVVHIKTEPRNGTPMKVHVKGCQCARLCSHPSLLLCSLQSRMRPRMHSVSD